MLRRRAPGLATTLLVCCLAVPMLVGGSASALTPAVTRLDDRQLTKSTGKKAWTRVSSRKAYRRTLLRTLRKNATLATKTPAVNGGSVTFQAGPRRGSFVLAVGRTKRTVKTSGRSVRLKTVTFRGSGAVKLTVTKPGRRGVYLDAITLNRLAPPIVLPPLPTSPAPGPPTPVASPSIPPPASVCPAETRDGGTLTSSRGTGVRVCQLPGRFTANTVLPRIDQVAYALAGPVEVGNDIGGNGARPGGNPVTLTILPGVVVIGDVPTDRLLVNRGSQINASGTETQPIVFTSRANLTGAATDGAWGGIAALGRGPISDCNAPVGGGSATCEQTLAYYTASFGGATPNDSSGTLRHVQIRYAGGGTPDVSALRLGGVGQLTTLDHINVVGSGGDALSVTGGRPNLKHLALVGAGDDVIDTDLGYRGTMQFVVGVQQAADGALVEVDQNGNEDALPRQYARISNATLVGRTGAGVRSSLLVRGGADFALLNSVVTGTPDCLDIDETGGTTTRPSDASGLQDLGPPAFRSTRLACSNPFTNDGNVTVGNVQTIFGSGTNNNQQAHAPTLNGIVNGANEAAVGATGATTFNADAIAGTGQPNTAAPNRMSAVTHVGAIPSAGDTAFRGWTCDSALASFGSGTSCAGSPL